jgi:hypothetical protein
LNWKSGSYVVNAWSFLLENHGQTFSHARCYIIGKSFAHENLNGKSWAIIYTWMCCMEYHGQSFMEHDFWMGVLTGYLHMDVVIGRTLRFIYQCMLWLENNCASSRNWCFKWTLHLKSHGKQSIHECFKWKIMKIICKNFLIENHRKSFAHWCFYSKITENHLHLDFLIGQSRGLICKWRFQLEVMGGHFLTKVSSGKW